MLTSGTEPGEMEYDEDEIRAAVEAAALTAIFLAARFASGGLATEMVSTRNNFV